MRRSGNAVGSPADILAVATQALKDASVITPLPATDLAPLADWMVVKFGPDAVTYSATQLAPYADAAIDCYDKNGKSTPLPAVDEPAIAGSIGTCNTSGQGTGGQQGFPGGGGPPPITITPKDFAEKCKASGGTYDAAAGTCTPKASSPKAPPSTVQQGSQEPDTSAPPQADPAAECNKKGGTWTGTVCSLSSAEPPAPGGYGLLWGVITLLVIGGAVAVTRTTPRKKASR